MDHTIKKKRIVVQKDGTAGLWEIGGAIGEKGFSQIICDSKRKSKKTY